MIAESEYERSDATALAEGVRRGEWSAEDVLETCLQRIGRLNGALNAMTDVYEARARTRLVSVEGPFAGVPFLLKDIGSPLAGEAMRRGSRFFKDAVPAVDAEHVLRLERAGLMIVGRTSTCELGLSLTCEPKLYGPTVNPWNSQLIPGGSSGGSAAAVASAMVPAAHATDGFGSIRVPAACCGLVGLKPSRGRNTLAPGAGENMGGLAAEHVVTRSVRDSAALLDATAGAGEGDPYAAPAPASSFTTVASRPPGPLRIALCSGRGLDLDVEKEQAEAARTVAVRLSGLGHHVEETDPPLDPRRAWDAFLAIMAVNTCVNLGSHPSGRKPAREDVEPITWAAFEHGSRLAAATYLRAIQSAHALGRAMARFHRQFDVLLTPMLAHAPPPPGWLDMGMEDAATYWERVFCFCPYAVWANLTGQPAMALPVGVPEAGLPKSVQLVARYGDEATLFALAGQLEANHPWNYPACRR